MLLATKAKYKNISWRVIDSGRTGKAMFLMKDLRDLRGRISYVLLYGPNRFPYRDFLSDEDQMTLDKAFEQLHQGVEIALPLKKFEGGLWDKKRQKFHDMLDSAYALFKSNDTENHRQARLLLDEFDHLIFKKK